MQIETYSTHDGPSIKCIRLGSIRFGHGLEVIELEWLLEKINLFLQGPWSEDRSKMLYWLTIV